jgi:hypothetical protein
MRGEIDSSCRFQDVVGALGNRSAHREASGHVHEGIEGGAVIAPNRLRQTGDGLGVRQITGIPVRLMSGLTNGAGTRFDARRLTVDEDHGGASQREGSGDNLADLSFGTDAGKEDRGSLEH